MILPIPSTRGTSQAMLDGQYPPQFCNESPIQQKYLATKQKFFGLAGASSRGTNYSGEGSTQIEQTIDTGTTRWSSAGHSGKVNQKNFDKKLFTANPLGALFTKRRRGSLWNVVHFDWLRS